MADQTLADWLGGARTQAPGTDDPDPLTDPLDPEPAGRRGRALWLIAVVPWLAVAAGLLALRGGGLTAAGDPAGADDPAGAHDAATVPEPPEDGPAPAKHRDGVEAAALTAVHLAVTGAGEDGSERYVELASVERLSRVDRDTVVVTVRAVVLDGVDGAWTGRRVARYAVPVRDAGAAPAASGDPWPVPPPDDVARADGAPDDDPRTGEAALAALAEAGYEDVDLEAVERVGGDLRRAVVSAVPPGERGPQRVEVWFAEEPAPHVLGLAADPPPDRKEQP